MLDRPRLVPALVIASMIVGCGVPDMPPPPRAQSLRLVEPLPPVRPADPPPGPAEPLKWRSRPAAERRQEFEDALRMYPNQHDAYLDLAEIADPSSIKVLMLRLCADYPEPKGPPPPGTQSGFDCAHVHLTDVLRSVTNQDAGMWCSEWRTWLQSNGTKTWNQWIREGFAQEGVTVSLPPTRQSVRALVTFMADDREWRRINAWRILSQLPPEELERRLAALAQTRDRVMRLGIERAREKLHGNP